VFQKVETLYLFFSPSPFVDLGPLVAGTPTAPGRRPRAFLHAVLGSDSRPGHGEVGPGRLPPGLRSPPLLLPFFSPGFLPPFLVSRSLNGWRDFFFVFPPFGLFPPFSSAVFSAGLRFPPSGSHHLFNITWRFFFLRAFNRVSVLFVAFFALHGRFFPTLPPEKVFGSEGTVGSFFFFRTCVGRTSTRRFLRSSSFPPSLGGARSNGARRF